MASKMFSPSGAAGVVGEKALVFQLRQVELIERHQVGDVQWAVNRVNILLFHLQRMA